MRVVIFFACIILLSACVSRDAKQAKYVDDLVQSYDGLNIIGMALSPDGRYLAVDTAEQYSLSDGLIRTKRVFITLYDLQKSEAKILNPLRVMTYGVGAHSPSFDLSGRYMVMVTDCYRPDISICDEVRYGSQIISMDLSAGDVEQISSAEMKHITWGYRWGSQSSSKSLPMKGSSLVKGGALLAPGGDVIYYLMSNGAYGSRFYNRQFGALFELRTLERKKDAAGDWEWQERPVITEDRGVTSFEGYGRLSITDTGRLLLSTNGLLGKDREFYKKRDVNAVFIEPETEKVSIAFDAINTPKIMDPKTKTLTDTRSYQHVMSSDGKRIAMLRGWGERIILFEDGKFLDFLTASDVGAGRFSGLEMSANGEWISFFMAKEKKHTDRGEYVWLVNVTSKEIRKFPLRSVIRQELNQITNDQ
ncbi:MAG: hypothetical protein JJ879_09570 [Sneathiella sp.]|nr:hypothetical protein [Sneathiella sp.]